jgi:hypothetical protein
MYKVSVLMTWHFLIQCNSCNVHILMSLNVLDAWYNGIDNTIYAVSCANTCWTLKKHFPSFDYEYHYEKKGPFAIGLVTQILNYNDHLQLVIFIRCEC